MIDKISLKIMNELCHDGRISNVELARKLGINVATVAKKINTMIEKGIIVIKAMPNPFVLGYHHFQAFIGLSVDLKKIDSVCNRLSENIHVHMMTTSFGRFDILLIVFFHELEIFQNFIRGELPQIDGINRVETYFISEEKKQIKGIFPEVLPKSKPVLDELDKKIIVELIRNGRPNYADLADKLGTSKPTVSRRIALLLKEGVIRVLGIPNLPKLGYSANAYVVVNAEYKKIDNICDQLTGYPEIHMVMRLMNDFDILFGIYSVNPDTLYMFLKNKVGYIDGILKTETFILGDYYYFSADALLPLSLGN